MSAMMVSLCSPPVHVSCPFMEPDTFFSQVHTFQACLFLVHCPPVQGYDNDAGPLVQEKYSRGGRNEYG